MWCVQNRDQAIGVQRQMFRIAGFALLACAIVLPAQAELREVEWHRDQAIAAEAVQQERYSRHRRYLAAIEARDPVVIRSLMLTQLRELPADRSPLTGQKFAIDRLPDADVLTDLDPPEASPPPLPTPRSLLERLATGHEHRPWLIVAGVVVILIGLLPSGGSGRP